MKTDSTVEMDCDVLIVGAGPAGLAAAIEMGRAGLRCIVIERNDRVGYAPRAKTTNVRTCEHLRRWGIVKALRAKAPLGVDYPSDIVFATRLTGYPLAKIDNAFFCAPARNPLYAAHAQWVPQYKLEETLRDHVLSMPHLQLCFRTTLESIRQNETDKAVYATVLDAAHDRRYGITARFLVGADGAHSTVRKLLGIEMEGVGALARHRMMIFRQPGLTAMHALPPAVMYWLLNQEVPSVMGPMDVDDKWYFSFTPKTDDDDPVEMLKKATGLPLTPEVLSSGDWTAYQQIAQRYRERSVFLIGDACHLHPPFGGYGMNLGVGDAVDLGWKMAAVVNGWGGAALLDSYESERRPVHQRIIEEAVINHAQSSLQLSVDGLEQPGAEGDAIRAEAGPRIADTKLREFRTLGVVLGYRYVASPINIDDGSEPPPEHFSHYTPSAHPGCRAPHMWLAEKNQFEPSLFDRFGPGFTLLITEGSEGDGAALAAVADSIGLPLKILNEAGSALKALYGARFAVIRPDQHVAWRGDRLPSEMSSLTDLLNILRGHHADAL
jgi:2-polyprenyl-6-methoxyphenol hydroxylase-like FAD-dependent oxidoreductase